MITIYRKPKMPSRANTRYDDGPMGRPPQSAAPPFGQRLAAARERRGLSQQQLAERLGTTREMVGYYERRAKNPTLDFLERVADALNVPVAELTGRAAARPARKPPGPDPRLVRRLEEIRKLPKAKQKALLQVLDMALDSSGA